MNNQAALVMVLMTAACKAPRGPAHQFFHWVWSRLTCLVQVVSGHLEQAQVHVGDGVEGTTGQEHHRDAALHLVRHVHTWCSGHSALWGQKLVSGSWHQDNC